MGYKEEFIDIFEKNIKREGAAELLEWIKGSDFLTAPASTKYHSAVEGGLCVHSMNVYKLLKKTCADFKADFSGESIAICGLLHDLCKANFYTVAYRNAKNEQGIWEKVPYYTINDQFPYGHGEKSVFLISRFMRLTDEEAMAIRWHMGSFDDSVKGGSFSISAAFENYRLPVFLHIADLEATYLYEHK